MLWTSSTDYKDTYTLEIGIIIAVSIVHIEENYSLNTFKTAVKDFFSFVWMLLG